MARVELSIGGRTYALACRDGDEARLESLGAVLDARAARLAGRLGQQTEGDLLMALAVTLADELDEAQQAMARAAVRIDAAALALEADAATP